MNVDLVHRTVAARAGQPPHPALLLLHGRGSDELDLLSLATEMGPSLFVLSARAPYMWQGGYRWVELDESGRQDLKTFSQSLTLLTRFVRELTATYPVDPNRLYLLGFSQGSMMANALTLTAPERVAGAILLSGYQPALDSLTAKPDLVRGKPFFVSHGTLDPLLSLDRGRDVRDSLISLGAEVTYREYAMGHQIIPQELADFNAWLNALLSGG